MTILLIDCGFVCRRAFHATGHLTNADIPVGVPFGVFQSLALWIQKFDTDRVIWCFDKGQSIRATVLPSYKHSRSIAASCDPAKAAERLAVRTATKDMAVKYLPSIGYAPGNIRHQLHYEADDLLAQAAIDNPNEKCVIITADGDLLQMLRLPHVQVYNPAAAKGLGKLWDADTFEEEKGVPPEMWHEVKAIAGCDTDDVPGVEGVGDAKAVQWLMGTMNTKTKTADNIRRADDIIKRNLQIVRLPWGGTMGGVYDEADSITPARWDAFLSELGCQDGSIPYPKVVSNVIEQRQ